MHTSKTTLSILLLSLLPSISIADSLSAADRRYEDLVSQAINTGDIRGRDELLSFFKRSDDLDELRSNLERLLAGDVTLRERVETSIAYHKMYLMQAIKENTHQHNRVFLAQVLWMESTFHKEVTHNNALFEKALSEGLKISKSLGNDSKTYDLYKQLNRVIHTVSDRPPR